MIRISKDNYFTYFIAFCCLILTFEAQLIFSFITTARLALVLLLLGFIQVFIQEGFIKFNRIYLPAIFILVILICWSIGTGAIHISLGNSFDFKQIISLALILGSILLLIFILENIKLNLLLFIRIIWMFGLISLGITVLYLFGISDFNFFSASVRIYTLKTFFNDSLVGGSSRFFMV